MGGRQPQPADGEYAQKLTVGEEQAAAARARQFVQQRFSRDRYDAIP